MIKCSKANLAKNRVLRNGKTFILVISFIHMIFGHLFFAGCGQNLDPNKIDRLSRVLFPSNIRMDNWP
tara:strand:- start:147 stop:350 length:204 start_codon:yes stop_codon:yes gene_type:complete